MPVTRDMENHQNSLLPTSSVRRTEASSHLNDLPDSPALGSTNQDHMGEALTMVNSKSSLPSGNLPTTSTQGGEASTTQYPAVQPAVTDVTEVPEAHVSSPPIIDNSANLRAPVDQNHTVDTAGTSSPPENLPITSTQAAQASTTPAQADGSPIAEPERIVNENNVVIKQTKKKGLGLFACRKFSGGETILHETFLMKSNIFPEKGWERAVRDYYAYDAMPTQKKAFLKLSKCGRGGRSIDARFSANAIDLREEGGGHKVYEWASRINHTCVRSNCVRIYNSKDCSITVKALTVIEEGQELLFNYYPQQIANGAPIPSTPLCRTFDCHCDWHEESRLQKRKNWLRHLHKIFCIFPFHSCEERMKLSDISDNRPSRTNGENNNAPTEHDKGPDSEADDGADSGPVNEADGGADSGPVHEADDGADSGSVHEADDGAGSEPVHEADDGADSGPVNEADDGANSESVNEPTYGLTNGRTIVHDPSIGLTIQLFPHSSSNRLSRQRFIQNLDRIEQAEQRADEPTIEHLEQPTNEPTTEHSGERRRRASKKPANKALKRSGGRCLKTQGAAL